jgi:uncharacterized membrane protein
MAAMRSPNTEDIPASGIDAPGLQPHRFSTADVAAALATGWHTFLAVPGSSTAFAALFALIGLVLLWAVGRVGVSPMALPLAGGFMLVGPVVLTGFFRMADLHDAGRAVRLRDALGSFVRAPAGLWVVALLCSFLFLIWITDAAVLYAFTIGGEHLPYALPWGLRLERHIVAFELWASLMGAVLAFIIFAVSAFSVPLLHARRASLAQALSASVRAVIGNLAASLAWGMLLTGATVLSIVLLPLLVVTLPVLAYASYALYRAVFPDEQSDADRPEGAATD